MVARMVGRAILCMRDDDCCAVLCCCVMIVVVVRAAVPMLMMMMGALCYGTEENTDTLLSRPRCDARACGMDDVTARCANTSAPNTAGNFCSSSREQLVLRLLVASFRLI